MPLGRRTEGAVVCRSCARLVGVTDETCYNCGARYPALWGWAPVLRDLGGDDLGFTKIVLVVNVLVYVGCLLMDPSAIQGGGLMSFLSPSGEALVAFGASGVYPVVGLGHWWTVLSAGWLHGGLLHIGFNLYWATKLIPWVARMFGPGRMVIIYLVSSVIGFALSTGASYVTFLVTGNVVPLTVGASAALMGMFGALVHYGRRTAQQDLTRWAWGYVIAILVMGLVFPNVDNFAHIGGFAGGWLVALVLDPAKPERLNHLAAALVLIGASVGAVLLSLLLNI